MEFLEAESKPGRAASGSLNPSLAQAASGKTAGVTELVASLDRQQVAHLPILPKLGTEEGGRDAMSSLAAPGAQTSLSLISGALASPAPPIVH